MFKQTMIAAAALTAAAWGSPAGAENYVTLGRLVCGSDGGQGLIVTSQKNLICTYTPASGGARRSMPERSRNSGSISARPARAS